MFNYTPLNDTSVAELLEILKKRFDENTNRHIGMKWSDIEKKLAGQSEKLWSLNEMEMTGGEPDVIGYDKESERFVFCDCAAESPKGRRSVCYDQDALESRKQHKPAHSAIGMAREMGIELLDENQYRVLQELGNFDSKTSSWLKAPDDIRHKGGAIFGDYRFGRIFIYHNGAESYYAARGFRGILLV